MRAALREALSHALRHSLPLRRLPSALLDDLVGYGAYGEPQETGDDHRVVQVTDDREEIGDQVEGHRKVGERCAGQQPRAARAPGMRHDEAIEGDLESEAAADLA